MVEKSTRVIDQQRLDWTVDMIIRQRLLWIIAARKMADLEKTHSPLSLIKVEVEAKPGAAKKAAPRKSITSPKSR